MRLPFIPTQEQVMLRDSVRRWGASRDVRKTESSDEVWTHAAEMGWLMAGIPEAAGGLGGTIFDSAIIAEEFGRALVQAPFVEVAIVSARLLVALAPQRAEALAAGLAQPIFAHDERAARGDPNWVETTAAAQGGAWRLTGYKTGLVGTGRVDSFLVSACIEGQGIGLFEVAAADAPLRAYSTIDDRAGGELLLDDTPATLLAEPARAHPAIEDAYAAALVGESAEAVGAMERAMEMTRDYLLTRKQYGQLIGEFQALRHRLADMFIEVEQARSMVLRGLGALKFGSAVERNVIAAATKARVAQAGMFVGAQAIQLHGGIGVTDEYPVGHYFKRLLAFDQRHGGSARQVERYAALARAAES